MTIQNIVFLPQISKFLSKKAHFRPYRPIEASPINDFNMKRCLIGFLIWGYENLLLPPKKLDLWPKNDQNWHFWQIWSYVWPKNNADKLPKCFFHYLVTKTFTYYHKKYDFWPKNGQILPKICIFGYFGPNIGIFCPFPPMPDQNQCEQGAWVGFPLFGYENFWFLQ